MSRHRDFGPPSRSGRALQTLEGAAEPKDSPNLAAIAAPNAESARRSRGWAITGEFQYEGFCYRIIRRPMSPAVEGALTAREEEVLSHLQQGLSNKQIAARLGVSSSTIGVLIHRAASRFRVKTRKELVTAYEQVRSTRVAR